MKTLSTPSLDGRGTTVALWITLLTLLLTTAHPTFANVKCLRQCRCERHSVSCPVTTLSIPGSPVCGIITTTERLQITPPLKVTQRKYNISKILTLLTCASKLRALDLSGINLVYTAHWLCQLYLLVPELTSLNLSATNMTEFPQKPCSQEAAIFARLENLNLSKNKLQSVSLANLLANFSGISTLDISYNKDISIYRNSVLKRSVPLHLIIKGLQVSEISEKTIPAIGDLVRLDISDSPMLKRIESSAFTGLTSLTVLTLHNCSQLKFLDSRSISQHLVSLRELDLTGCSSLKQLDLADSKKLRILRLNHTGIAGLRPPSVLTTADAKKITLEQLEVSGTANWNCSCEILWVSRILSPTSEALCSWPPEMKGQPLPRELANCSSPQVSNCTYSAHKGLRLSEEVVVKCVVDGQPSPDLYWTTPSGEHKVFRYSRNVLYPHVEYTGSRKFHSNHHWHNEIEDYVFGIGEERLYILAGDGALYIDYLTRKDPGVYKVRALNPLGNATSQVTLIMAPVMLSIRNHCLFVGLACSVIMLITGFIVTLGRSISNRCSREEQAKRQSLSQLLESIAAYRVTKADKFRAYRHRQLDQFRGNCTNQVTRIKELCTNYGVAMQDNYNRRINKIRENCEFRVMRLHDSYSKQRLRMKDYKSSQVERLRDNYQQHVVKIREYAANQVDRLREQYRLQQQYMTKLIEVLNLESCMPGIEEEDGDSSPDPIAPIISKFLDFDEDLEDLQFPEDLCSMEIPILMERSASQDSDDFVTADDESDDIENETKSSMTAGADDIEMTQRNTTIVNVQNV